MKRDIAITLVERAVERGELAASADRDLAVDMIQGPLYWALIVRRRPMGPAEVEAMATTIEAALRAGG